MTKNTVFNIHFMSEKSLLITGGTEVLGRNRKLSLEKRLDIGRIVIFSRDELKHGR